MKQTKENFLANVRYWAGRLDQRADWLAQCGDRENPVDLDPELKAIYDECDKHERLMCEAAVRLAERCAEKLREL